MNMSDLSRDDDFLSHLFVEKLGTGSVPLFVHKMDSSRRLPKTDANDILQIVRRLVASKAQPSVAIREAVDSLFLLRPIRYYLSGFPDKQINAFATHASRYLELYLPNGSIEIAHTSRYAHATGKSELCILATRPLAPGAVIAELKGSMADLTDEEDRELKCATATGQAGIRRDFSVIHSKQLKKNHLFLGPARFVNHDCGNNVELFREGRYITFRVIKPIAVGEEVTAHYGDDYFGRNNRHCLCHTCESGGRGGYTPEEGVDPPSDSDSDTSDRSSQRPREGGSVATLNVNERRTRRGVYAVMPENQIKEREQSTIPKIELDNEDSLLSLTFPSPSTNNGALLETPQLSRESSTTSREVSKSDIVVRTSARLRGRPSNPSLDPRSSRLATPEDRLRSASRGRTSGTEPPEQRVLRPRAPDLGAGKNPSGRSEGSSQKPNPTKKTVPRGVPTCVVCKGILPVISVDSEIVWGLEGYDEKGKKLKGKRGSSLECPRCMRHREIYNVSWPYRLVSHGGTAYPTPPPADPPVTSHSSKSRQESPEASLPRSISSKAASKNRRDDEDQRPSKRQKVEAVVETLSAERSRSGRLHIPSRKLREATDDHEKSIPAPQKSPQVAVNSSKQKQPQKEVAPQPPKKSRAERADERSKIREQMEKALGAKSHACTIARTSISDAGAGPADGMVRQSTSSRKRPRTEEQVSVKRSCSVEAAEASEVLASPALRPSISGIRGFRKGGSSGFLGVAPNPINLARRKWVPIVPDSDSPDEPITDLDPPPRAESSLSSTTEDSLQLNTPRDSDGPNPEVNSSGETESVQTTRRPHGFLNRAMKPSPVNFAMRRWSSMDSPKSDRSETDSQDELDDPMPRKSAPIVDITLLSSPESSRRSNARFTTPEPRSYVPSRIWETGDDKRTPLESPDSSLFVLRHKATFTSSPGGGSFTDDSERMVERLVYADSPNRDDTSDIQQAGDITVKTNGLSRSDVEEILGPLHCVDLGLERVSLPAITTTPFATVSAGSKLFKSGWDAGR